MAPPTEFVADAYSPGGLTLMVDGDAQSHLDLGDPTRLFFEYTRRIGHVFDVLTNPPVAPVRALHLGGGALTLPRYLAATRPGSAQIVIEIDPDLVALVGERAPVPASAGITVVVGDAAEEVPRLAAGHPFDVVVVDLYRGLEMPAFASTPEFVAACAGLIAPGGALVWNIADAPGRSRLRALVGLLHRAVPTVELVAAGPSEVCAGTEDGNIVLVAAAQPTLDRIAKALGERGPFPASVLDGGALRELAGV